MRLQPVLTTLCLALTGALTGDHALGGSDGA